MTHQIAPILSSPCQEHADSTKASHYSQGRHANTASEVSDVTGKSVTRVTNEPARPQRNKCSLRPQCRHAVLVAHAEAHLLYPPCSSVLLPLPRYLRHCCRPLPKNSQVQPRLPTSVFNHLHNMTRACCKDLLVQLWLGSRSTHLALGLHGRGKKKNPSTQSPAHMHTRCLSR